MSTQYGLALVAPSVQTLVPAMTKDGRVYGFYPISSTTFTGSETTLTLADASMPLLSVTVDNSEPTQFQDTQFMAAVWPTGLADNYKPWQGSASFVPASDGFYRSWSMPSQGAIVRSGKGALLNALSYGTSSVTTVTTPPGAPTVTTPASAQWAASLAYKELLGDLTYFDFNWVTLFGVVSGASPARIVVMTNPGGGTLKATVVGIPVATASGPIYDTIRIIKVADTAAGVYAFTFRVYDTLGQYTNATLTLTVI